MEHGNLLVEGDHTDEPFVTPVFPGSLFFFVDQNGDEDGPFDPEDFSHDEDNIWAAQTPGRSVILRVIQQRGDTLWVIDGAGEGWQYTMIPAGAPVGV